MAAAMSNLPVEIYQEIIDHFAAQYPSPKFFDSMHAVSLTCQMFLSLARPHIFRHIDISGDHDITGVRRKNLARILQKEPNIARNVEAISYTFYTNHEHLTQDPLKELLQCIIALPYLKTISIDMKYPQNKKLLFRPPQAPVFGWQYILHAVKSSRTILDTLSVTASRRLILPIKLSSIPAVRNLKLHGCILDYRPQNIIYQCIQSEVEAHLYTLTSLRLACEYSCIPLALLAQCTHLSDLGCEVNYDGSVDKLPGSDLPFKNLKKIELMKDDGGQLEYILAYATARGLCMGAAVFPALQDLSMSIQRWTHPRGHWGREIPGDSLSYEIFKHMPVLETLALHGHPLIGIDFSKALNPLSPSLKTLSLHPDFKDDAYYRRSPVKLPEFLNTLEYLSLTALETFSLHLQLGTSIHEQDRSTNPRRSIHRAIGKSTLDTISKLFLKHQTSRFPSLKKLELKITMMVYKNIGYDDLDEEAIYRKKAIKALHRYFNEVDPNGRFSFAWEVNVFRRSIGMNDVGDEDESSKEDHGGEDWSSDYGDDGVDDDDEDDEDW